jgi:hypothetical protein
MSKQTANRICTGQLEGVKLGIKKIHNDGLQESVVILNQGTMAQPMNGWTLASLRGELFFRFPDHLILLPSMKVVIHSGQQKERQSWRELTGQVDLFWTNEQVWNNHGDVAILFDADGIEIDRYAYPYERVMGSDADDTKILVPKSDGYHIIDAPTRKPGRTIRHISKPTS